MARKSSAATPNNPTRGEAILQELANSNSSPEQLMQQAAPLLNSKELLRDVQGLTPKDQTKFVDKIDQVRRLDLSEPSLHYFCTGISVHRRAKCKIYIHLGERVQCNSTTSDFSRTFRRARETWQHCPRIWRAYGCLAGGVP
jgi:hypothetical protein